MGVDPASWAGIGAAWGLVGGMASTAKTIMDVTADDPEAQDLEEDASKRAEMQRLSLERQKATKGKTMFSQPAGAGGAALKQSFGE